MTDANNTIAYTYDDSGIRTSKTVNGTKTDYYLNGTAIIMQKTGDQCIWYTYDESGNLSGLRVGNSEYYYYRNGQGDIIGIIDGTGSIAAKYSYDAWGTPIAITDGAGNDVSGNASHIANVNPFRYRGYFYDTETGLYYLQSRYYDPQVGRFLNADGYVSTGQDVLGHNMFVYCGNNPVNKYDPTGKFALTAILTGGIALGKIAGAVIGLVGAFVVADIIVNNPPASPSLSLPKFNIKPKTESKEKDIAPTIPKSLPGDTVIYRYGGTNPRNLTPRAKDRYSGLSFSTIPKPGAAMTTIEALNATGLVYAVQDGPTHVSVRPVGVSIDEWIEAGPVSIWTAAVKSVVVKWDGVT